MCNLQSTAPLKQRSIRLGSGKSIVVIGGPPLMLLQHCIPNKKDHAGGHGRTGTAARTRAAAGGTEGVA